MSPGELQCRVGERLRHDPVAELVRAALASVLAIKRARIKSPGRGKSLAKAKSPDRVNNQDRVNSRDRVNSQEEAEIVRAIPSC